MKILIVVATKYEVGPLMTHFRLPDHKFTGNEHFDVLITGVGITATAYALGKHLSKNYNLVLNLGIAGSFDRELDLGTVLNVTEDTFSELGAEDNEDFLRIDDLNLGKSTYYAYNNLLSDSIIKLKKVKGITVSCIHGSEKSIAAITARLSPTTESMEGASVLFCCEQEDIPCLQIRTISNFVEPRNRESWKIDLAISNLNNWAIDFLTNT
ncbi:MAG: futalosine hydrolase [Sphingobacteriales bacterium]|nr:MAG: futalosine hydrolase [Sphingobacteriales bacterium]